MDQSPPVLGWLFEVIGPLIWLALAAFFAYTCFKRRELTLPTLVFIGGTTMWWQEWYGDWGAYVLYNPHLALIPGYDWPLTSPNKPWAVIPAYGWFYALVYFPVGLSSTSGTPSSRAARRSSEFGATSTSWGPPWRAPAGTSHCSTQCSPSPR